MARGRKPTKLDSARIEKLVTALAAGNTRRSAALWAGVDPSTVQRRQARDPAFGRMLRDAEERAVLRNVALIQTAANTHWQAAAWWLERRFPEDWGRHLAISGPGPGGALTVEGPPTVIVLPGNGRTPGELPEVVTRVRLLHPQQNGPDGPTPAG